MKGLVKKLSFVLIIIAIAIIAIFNQQTIKTIGINQITDPEILAEMTYAQLKEKDKKVSGTDNILFSAFFLRDLDKDGYAEKIKGTCKSINDTDMLYIDFNVLGAGRFVNGNISLKLANCEWETVLVADNVVQDNHKGRVANIRLNDDLLGGSQKLFWGSISPKIDNNINNYHGINQIILTGTYIDEDQNSIPIRKTVYLPVDWYGTTGTKVNKYKTIQRNNLETLIQDDLVKVQFVATVSESKQELILQKQEVEIDIPELNGYKATNAYAKDDKYTSTFNSNTQKLKVTNASTVDDTGKIQKSIARNNEYELVLVYPIEAYQANEDSNLSIDIKVTGKNYGYNNNYSANYFTNPEISSDSNVITVIYEQPTVEEENEVPISYVIEPYTPRTVWSINTTIGEYVYSPISGTGMRVSKDHIIDKYNGNDYENFDNSYRVAWNITLYYSDGIGTMIFEEPKLEDETSKKDNFIKSSNERISTRDYETVTKIQFKDIYKILGKDGWIKIYDADTGVLQETLTYEQWGNTYPLNVKSIRVETSAPINSGSFKIYQTKELDAEKIVQDFTKEEFQSFRYMQTYLKGVINAMPDATFKNGNTTETKTCTGQARYDEAVSIAKISVSPTTISNQQTENVNIYLHTISSNDFEKKWINGQFLVELPPDIISVGINSVTATLGSEPLNYSLIKQDDRYLIKIIMNNDVEESHGITINADITANPTKPSQSEEIVLYAYNENCNNYNDFVLDKYDANVNGSTTDNIGHATTTLTTGAPSQLLTTEYVTNYDDNNSVAIAPNVAEINKESGENTATINIGVLNNYIGTVSEVQILGRTPYQGNKYVLLGQSLKSTYTAELTGPINIPEELQGKITIYYSTNGEATRDLEDPDNEWTTTVTDYSLIRSYLIDFGDYNYTQMSNDVFTYEVRVPANLGYESATFSTHCIYYTLDTQAGKIYQQTEPNRVGIQIVGKYNMQITKNKLGNENTKVEGAMYRLAGLDVNGREISQVETTDQNGNLTFRDIYIGREYTLEEILSPKDYVLNEEKIKFITNLDELGNLSVTTLEGSFKEQPEFVINNNVILVKAKVEDDTKYTITLNKKDENNQIIEGVLFSFGNENNVKVYSTDNTGKIVFRGLDIGKEYKLKEVKAKGYYTDEDYRTFKMERNQNNELVMVSNDPELSNAIISYPDQIVQTQVEINIVNEKIPTYKLQIMKVNEIKGNEEEIPLAGAHFRFESTDDNEQEEYVTDENGIIGIDGLYTYIEGKSITGKYIIHELKAPDGYTNNVERISFRVEKKQDDSLEIKIDNVNLLTTLKEATIEDNIVKIKIQDKPLFKLTKIDKETGLPLANAEFIIYRMKDDVIEYAKDPNGYYIGELNAEGDYVVKTNELGEIILPLPNGIYCAAEVKYPEGYKEMGTKEYFRVGTIENEDQIIEDVGDETGESSETSNSEDLEVVEINYIEDLVDLSNEVNEGINYENTVIKLKRSLDFNNSEHYRDATSLDYGDLNGDEVISTIKDEVTLENSIGFKPIGKDKENAFKGIFDGQNYKIENLYQNNSYEYTGLFGYVSGGTIKDLGVSASIKNNGNVSDIQSYYSGIIAGIIEKNSRIENCYTEGSIVNSASGRNRNYTTAGGIVGCSRGEIKNCYNSGTVRTSASGMRVRNTARSGGIAGESTGTITNCYNLGRITSRASGTSASNNAASGGITAYTDGIIRNCYNKGTVSGSISSGGYSYVGGIVGSLGTNGTILNCYNTNDISASGTSNENSGSYAGGIAGGTADNALVSYCYSIGNVSAGTFGRAIIGESKGVCNNSVYLNSITTSDSNLEGYAETSSYMKSDAMIKYMGERNWSKDIENSNDGYPILKPYIEMTDEDKIKEINYIEDLVDLEKDINTGEDYSNITIKLNRTLNFENEESYRDYSSTSYGDINGNGTLESIINELISEKGFTPIGICNNTAYCGCFDGQGYVIQNLYENITGITGNYAGLFGHVEKGEIKNLGITGNINISGRLRNVNAGGIAGYTGKDVAISNCYSVLNIDAILNDPTSTHIYYGTFNAGGIVGKTDGLVRDSYNMGTFSFSTNSSKGSGYIGGIAGRVSSTGKVSNCYNEGMDGISGSAYIGGIVGTSDGIITDCYNTTNFELEDAHEYTGGIVGTSTGIVNKCYNNGNIICENSWMGIGGIVGYNAGSVSNTYNTGTIQSDYSYSSLGGIVGYSAYEGTVKNSYDIGNIIAGEVEDSEYSEPGAVGAIIGNEESAINSYYLDSITMEGTTLYNSENESVSDSYMRTKDFYGKLNKDLAWYYIEGEYPILLNDSLLNALEPNVEIIVDNEIKKFKITTDVLEEDGVKGGTISGEDEDPYELVTYNQNSTKSIEIIPEDDYVISKITINGESIEYVPDENRVYTIPENYFKNVKEDKHIVVTFSSVDKSIKIKKVDKDGNPLDGATFEAESTSTPQLARIVNTGEVITSVDLNQEITNVLGNLENNGMEYAEENKMQPVENVLGPLNSNSTYGFDLNSDNQYVSNNQGVSSSTANSYFTIDLTEKTGNYVAVVNANVSSESSYDYGYATITTSNSSTPLYSSTSGRFIYISGTSTTVTTPTDYTSTVLTGGNVYYLYLGYRKDSSGNTGSDTFTVNSINIYETHSVKYGFENQEGALVSNNNGKHNTTANSMIPIDLRELNDSYYVAVNANVSSASGDYGYATISTSTTAPAYNSASGRFIYINGTSTTVTTPTDYYSSLLTGGQLYYLHLGYYKNASSSLGNDCFTVNDIKVYKANTKQLGFEEDDGEYTPNNLENPGKTATSYIKLDLSEHPGEYKIKVNAEINSRRGYDYGYMFVTNNTDTPYIYDETGRLFLISGLISAKDYEMTIEGGKIYYIHLAYERSSSTYVTPVENEYFRINSIEVSRKDKYTATTNEEGEAIISVKDFGEYIIKETKAPEHYLLSEEEQVVNITYGNPIQEVQFENERASEVIVHHYLMGTTEKVAKDDVLEGKIGETYEARPHLDLDKLKLHMDEATRYEDFKGLFTEENKEINFYYEADKIKLTIHHYKNGTEDAIVDDEVIETESDIAFEGELQYNVTTQGSYELKENDNYKQLSKKLDFVSVNSELDYDLTIDDTLEYTRDAEVTYYYDVTENSYTVNYFYNNVKDENATEVLTGIFKEYSEYPDKCIDGYIFDKAKALDEEGNETDLPLIIKENSEYNVINVYYESIDYIVHYKELGTDNNVAEDKMGKGHTIGEIIQEEAIEVEGYDKVAPTEISIEVIAGTNEVTFYYTKRTDLSYTVNYLEKDTNNVLHTAKTEPNQTFGQVITSVDEVITIYGYDYDSADKDSLTIGVNVSENIINLYYTKKDTSVIAHYYIEGTTNKVPSNVEGEVVEDVTIEGKVNDTYTTESAENISSIYELVATPTNATGTMTEETIDVYYYYKLKNYDYTVEYYYDNVIDNEKTDTLSETYGKQITEYTDKVITGYKFDKTENLPLTISDNTSNNVIKVYYIKRTDLSYTVNYLEKGTNRVISTQKVEGNQTFGKEITAADEVITIYGYDYDSADKDSLTIGTEASENVINLYYTKKNAKVTAKYMLENTTTEIANSVEHTGKVGETYTTHPSEDIESKYELISATPEGYTGEYTEDDITVIYYYRLKDTSVTAHYYIEGTNNKVPSNVEGEVVEDATIEGKVDDTYTTESAENISSIYELVATPTNATGTMTVESIDVYYYYKLKNYDYTVEYYYDNVIDDTKTDTLSETYGKQITEYTDKVITGYKFDKTENLPLTISDNTSNNVIKVYYTKRNDLSYTVNYLEKNTNNVLHTAKTEPNQTFGDEIASVNEKITIDGYNYDSVDPETLTIGAALENNVINIYYTKRTDLSYIVNYLEKNTNNILHTAKTEPNQTFGDEIASVNEKITIDGYNYDSVDPETLTIGAVSENNVINVYYTKRNDLSYTVNYLEKNTNNVLHTAKTEPNQTFGDEIASVNEKITIDGYNYDSVDPETLTIGAVSENNVINVYYTKRNDLSYTVNYLEKNTNNVLHTAKTEPNQAFGDVIRALDEVIAIYGYYYDSADKDSLTIGTETSENVINLYYTRADASVLVHYYIENTTTRVPSTTDGEEVADATLNGLVGDTYTTTQASNVSNKYELVSATPVGYTGTYTEDDITVIYYYRLKDTSVTAHYYIEGTTNKVPSNVEGEVVEDATIEGKVDDTYTTNPAGNVSSIYELVATPENATGTMTVESIDVYYYYKLKNYDYTVEYYYDNVIDNEKTDTLSETYGKQITEYTDKVITGYKFDKTENLPLTISDNTSNNVIKVYYTKRNDLSYTVNYLEKNTNNVLNTAKTEPNQTFGDVITAADEVITIYGYDYDSADKDSLTIGTEASENVINLYYTKKNAKVTAKYMLENTTTEIANPVEHTGKVGETYTTHPSEDIESKYELISATPEGYTGTYTEDDITVIYYYRLKDTQVIVHHYIQNNDGTLTTTKVPSNVDGKVVEDVVISGKVDDGYTTSAATNLHNSYELVITPEKATGIMTEDQIEIAYYYALKDAKAVARYVDLYAQLVKPDDTDEIAERQTKTGKVGDAYTTDQKTIEEYTFIRDTNNTSGTLTVEDIDVVYYYAPNTYVKVRYLEKGTNEVLVPEKTINGFAGKDYATDEETIENYTLVEVAGTANGTMTVNPITVTYYYSQNTKARVEYIDKADGRVMDSIEKTGLVGDEFATEAKEFENYILVESPNVTTVNMTKDVITLKYYYAYANASLIVRHINVITGAVIESSIENGKVEGETYETTAKDIEGYDLVGEYNGHDYTPQNARGTYTKETITVDYYYIRKTSVTAKYIDKATGETLTKDVVINGHENDPYQTNEKTISGYALDSVDGDKTGTMTITTDSEGNVVTNKEVVYYYKKASTVKVNHIDISTDEVLIAEIKNGYEGDNYSTTAKSIEGYDLVETRLPENKDGIFTRDEQTVNYYYIPRLTVKVIYQDEDGTELDQDHIEGHEGDEYTTVEKKFKGYEIAEVPNNAEGTMVVTKDENGNRNTEIIVIYKYKKLIPKDVIEKYIDINTDETVKEVIHKGELGEVYSIKPKTIPGYTLLTEDENGNSLLPTNTTGKYTTEKGEVVFYVIKNASVRVQHINLITGEKMADDVIIEGYEGRGYTTEALTFEGYELTGIPENARGKMKVTIDENGNKVSEIVVKYYYAEKLDGRLPKTNESNTKQAILIAIPFVVLVNLCLCAKTFEKSKKSKEKEMRKNKKAKAEESDK